MAQTVNQDVVDQLNDLIALDFDAAAAYESAISRLNDAQVKSRLQAFKGDHDRHIRELSDLCRTYGGEPRKKGDMMQLLTQGQVVIRSLTGDKGILQAMKSNEDQTNSYYEQALQKEGLPADVRTLLEKNLGDERRHRAWIIEQLNRMP